MKALCDEQLHHIHHGQNILDHQEHNQTDLKGNPHSIQCPEEGNSYRVGNIVCLENMSSKNILNLHCKSPSKHIHQVELLHQCEDFGDILQAQSILGYPGLNFINVKCTNFSFSIYMYVEKTAKMMFVRKKRSKNVDEIDTW